MKANIAVFLFLLSVLSAFAGARIIFTCENPKCHFNATCDSGGGFNFEQLSGYCFVCKKFVSVAWDRKKSPPPGLDVVWNPQQMGLLKKDKNLFPCPSCKNPVYSFSIDTNTKERFYCPKCFHHTLRAETQLNYD